MRIITVIFLALAFVSAAEAAWRRVETGTLAWLHAVQFVDGQYGWAAGSQGTLLSTTDGGNTWKRTAIGTSDTIRDIHFADRWNGWLLCERSRFEEEAGNASYLLRTTNGGVTWTAAEIPGRPGRMNRILFVSGERGILIGEGGATVGIADAKGESFGSVLPDRHLILDGAAVTGSRVILVGGGGSVFLSEDSGNSWRPAKFIGTTPQAKLNAIDFSDADHGWAAGNGGTIFATSDGGRSWTAQISGTAEALHDVKFCDAQRGYIVGENGIILRTLNSGRTWAIESSGTRHRLERVASTGVQMFAVGFGGIMITNDIKLKG